MPYNGGYPPFSRTMSNFRSFDDLNNFPARDPFSRVANQLRATLCNAFDTFPGLFLPPDLPGTRAIREANRDFFEDTICPPPDIPGVNPPAQFVPGCNVIYDVRITYRARPDGSPITQVRDGSNIVRAEGYPVGNDRVRLDMFQADGQNVGRFYIANNVPSDFPGFEVLDVKVERRDGQPVNTPCTVPPVVNPEVIIPPDITVRIGGSPTTVNITPVTYNVDGDTYFSPSFNTSLGPIEFSLGGVNFGPIFLPPIIPVPVIGGNGGGVTPQQVADIVQTANDLQSQVLIDALQTDCPTLQEIADVIQTANDLQSGFLLEGINARLQALADFIQCLVLEEGQVIDSEPIVSSTLGGTFALPQNTVAVFVSLVGSPAPGTRPQSGSGSAPNLFYWGWYAFGRFGSGGQRDELIYADQMLPVPDFAQEVIINPTFGNLASATAITVSSNCELQLP